MDDRVIPAVPTFSLIDLDGKTLTITVGRDYDMERGVRSTVVIGTDAIGRSYVLMDKQEPIDVRPEQR